MFLGKSTQSYETILAEYPGPVFLRPSRRKWSIMLVGCSLFVLGGAFVLHAPGTMSSSDVLWAWFGVVFFGLGVLLSAVILCVPSANELILDRDGFTTHVLFRRKAFSWQQVSGFSVARIVPARKEMVVYDDARIAGTVADFNRKLTGRNCGLPDTYGLGAEELAKLMTAWRDRALLGR